MNRRIGIVALSGLAVVLLVAALAALIIESSKVDEDYYVAHAERLRAIETSKDGLGSIIQDAKGAFAEGRAAPSSIDVSLERLSGNNELLQDVTGLPGLDETVAANLASYSAMLDIFMRDTRAFAARQDALSEALRNLQEESPAVVKDLRRFNLRVQSANVFSLAIDIVEYASGQRKTDLSQLATRIDALASDSGIERLAPGRLDSFITAAGLVIAEFSAAQLALDKVVGSQLSDELWSLSNAILDDNRRTVSRAERARLLLSICTVLLLVGIGIVIVRLQSSYQALNKSNAELETVNNSLEDRVAARTVELSEAIEELKESQVQLVQAEKMSSLGELVAGISHEINTPLWYLMSNSTVVQERLDVADEFCGIAIKMLDAVKARKAVNEEVGKGLIDMQKMFDEGLKDDLDEAKDLVKDSIEGLEELTELAQSLKDFSRLDRSRQGQFNVNDGLEKTLLIARNKLKNKSSVHKHYGEVPPIHCAPSQINQIFLNLITNAADAITEHGEILIRTWEETGRVGVSVSDTGSGIPADVLPKIRDPFFTTKDVGKGTGLGLSIVDQIVEAHKGELQIESEEGKGTTVTIILPIGQPVREQKPKQEVDDDALPVLAANDAVDGLVDQISDTTDPVSETATV